MSIRIPERKTFARRTPIRPSHLKMSNSNLGAFKKKFFVLGIFPKPVDPPPPLGTFRNKNVNFGQI